MESNELVIAAGSAVLQRFGFCELMESGSECKRELRVILVEDNPFDAELIEMSLRERVPCLVTVVFTQAAFLEQLRLNVPDVIISDSNLPHFDGMTALRLAQEHYPQVPFVFCTGTVADQAKAEGLAQGARYWLSKNDLPGFATTIGRLCGVIVG